IGRAGDARGSPHGSREADAGGDRRRELGTEGPGGGTRPGGLEPRRGGREGASQPEARGGYQEPQAGCEAGQIGQGGSRQEGGASGVAEAASVARRKKTAPVREYAHGRRFAFSLLVLELVPRVRLAPVHDEGDVAEKANVGERVGVQDEQVRHGAGSDCAGAVEAEDSRSVPRRGDEHVARCEAGRLHRLELLEDRRAVQCELVASADAEYT